MFTFGSLFAGIGGFDKGFLDAGMQCRWQVEKDDAARAVLAFQFADTPQYVDVRDVGAHNLAPVDVICGGFPCQDLSVAGRRAGLAGARSGLFYEMTRITYELQPALLVWENVPGLLSSRGGRDFFAVLMELERIGYHGCWTTLDAQFFGVAQRRQRVFGVFARHDIGASRCAEILALTTRMPGYPSAGRSPRADVATSVTPGTRRGDQHGASLVANSLTASAGHHGHSSPRGDGSDNLVVGTLGAAYGKNRGLGQENEVDNLVAYGIGGKASSATADVSNRSHASGGPSGMGITENLAPILRAGRQMSVGYDAPATAGVRRLTPMECERLQGFRDGWTAQNANGPQSDSARYKQLGNAVCCNVARWLGQRIVVALGEVA